MVESPLLLQELLRKTAGGDAAAFALLYKHTARKLFGVAIRIAGRGEIAEDALQECFVTVWQRATDYDPMRGAAMSWLIAILRNCTIDRLRRQRARPEGHAAPEEALRHLAAPDNAGKGAELRALRACLDQLDEQPRRAVLLAYLYGLTREELAAQFAVPVGTVKSWIPPQPRSLETVPRPMKYDSPELREQLAAEYVLGTMPILARRRFERLLASDLELRRVVEAWTDRFGPIDRATAPQEPPARVWRAVERRLGLPPAVTTARARWFDSLAFWRGATFAAAAIAAIAIAYVAVRAPPTPTNVVAILSDDQGDPAWIAQSGVGGEVAVAPIRKIAVDAAHTFELWAIAGGPPHSLGLLPAEPGRKLTVQASLLPASGVLAVSIEPVDGSPTGQPTGPVPYKGKLLPREP